MDDRGCFSQAMRLDDIDDVLICVPGEFHGREWVIPTKVHRPDPVPMVRDLEWRDRDGFFRNREDTTRAQNRNALGARVPLVNRIARDDLLTLFRREMLGLFDR